MSALYVPYYRVSTVRQGRSGLGLEAQQAAVRRFLKPTDQVLQEFTEVESGKNDNREQLQAAIALAKSASAVLVIAKLDRLSRNAAFIFQLRDSNVEFVCVDMPEANTLTVGIFATMAQHERELISARTRAGLAALKARGKTLGTPRNLTPEAGLKGAAARKKLAAANPNNRRAAAMARSLRAAGHSWSSIARELNGSGFATSTGRTFQAIQVQRLVSSPQKDSAPTA